MPENAANISATERQVFYIDTGDMPAHQVRAYLEEVANNSRGQKTPRVNSSADKMVEASSIILEGLANFVD